MKPNSVIILAAGNGSRMKSSIPKVFHKVGGASLLDHVIKTAKDIDSEKIVVVVQENHPIKDLVYGEYVSFAYQMKPRGTGDAVKCALEEINCENEGWVYVLYADIPLISPLTLKKLEETTKNDSKIGVVILAMDTDDSNALGKLEAAEEYGMVKGIVEAKDIEQFESHSHNINLMHNSDVDLTFDPMITQRNIYEDSFDVYDTTRQKNIDIQLSQQSPHSLTPNNAGNNGYYNENYRLAASDKVCIRVTDTEFCYLNEKSDKARLMPLCNAGLLIKKSLLKNLIDQIAPSKATGEIYITEIVRLAYSHGFKCTYYKGDSLELSGVNTRFDLAKIEKQFQENMRNKHMANGVTLIAPETVFFSYDTEIENDVTIQQYVIFLKNVKIKSGSVVCSFCSIEGTEIKNAQVGPFSRTRAGTEIQNNAKIGNFVEIKNSVVSEDTKVNHLSYIGDSYIGSNSNIGAGTITCNYDGFKKHKTYIGENVFVGSNSAIVAPVKICDNAMIGAGSVITKNVNDGDLAVSRSNQVNLEKGAISFRENAKYNNRKKEKSCAE